MEIKNLIASLKQTNPFIEGNIFKSVENVNLRTIIAYKEDGVKHHFWSITTSGNSVNRAPALDGKGIFIL